MRFGISDEIIDEIINSIKRYTVVTKAVIFGSRARGDYKYNSDIDVALYTEGEPKAGLYLTIDDAAGIYKTNIIIVEKVTNQKLLKNIEQDGVEIYRR